MIWLEILKYHSLKGNNFNVILKNLYPRIRISEYDAAIDMAPSSDNIMHTQV